METRANFILIGAFTLFGIIGTLAFMVWLASAQLDRQYATYGILFDDVSGLSASGDVQFNGIAVGRVIDLHISQDDPSKVFVGIQVDATTPVREDTVAQLSSSGVTGVSYISLSNTQREAPALTAPPGEIPIITSRRSTVQQLVEDAPDLITEATKLLARFQEIAGPENQTYVSNILRNLDSASGGLEQALSDFTSITGIVGDATDQITLFTERLDAIGASIQTTLVNADETLAAATEAFDSTQAAITSSTSAIDNAGGAFAEAEKLMREQVPNIVAQISDTVDALNAAVADLSARSANTLTGFGDTADLLNARLSQLEKTLTEADSAFAAVTGASDSFYNLVDGDGALLVSDARAVLADAKTAIGTVETVINKDVPVVVEDIRGAVATASKAVDRVANDLTGLTGRLDPLAADAQKTLTTATQIFERAGQTMDNLDRSLGATDRALASAETAFDTATDVMSTDFDPLLTDIRTASDRIGAAAEKVSDDLPAITADLRALIARADEVVGQVKSTVAGAAPGITQFAGSGLPELSRLGAEARRLVRSLDQLVRRIDRDPARFLLDERVPEYRR